MKPHKDTRLEEFRFPEPNSIDQTHNYTFYHWYPKNEGCGKFTIGICNLSHVAIVCGWKAEIKSDTDWETIARYVRFLTKNAKGLYESDNS